MAERHHPLRGAASIIGVGSTDYAALKVRSEAVPPLDLAAMAIDAALADADLARAVEATGMACVVTDTVMADLAVAAALAKTTLEAAR